MGNVFRNLLAQAFTHAALLDNANKISSFRQFTGIVVIRFEVATCSFLIGVIAHTILRIGVVTMKNKYRLVRRIVFWCEQIDRSLNPFTDSEPKLFLYIHPTVNALQAFCRKRGGG